MSKNSKNIDISGIRVDRIDKFDQYVEIPVIFRHVRSIGRSDRHDPDLRGNSAARGLQRRPDNSRCSDRSLTASRWATAAVTAVMAQCLRESVGRDAGLRVQHCPGAGTGLRRHGFCLT